MKVLAIIPVYNEEKGIKNVIDKTKEFVDDILVVDDGSTDNTLNVIKEREVNFISYSPNRGKGNALIKGFNYVQDKDYDVIITLDADGEHKPEHVPEFLEKIKQYGFVVGQRKDYRSFKRKTLNYFATFWFMLLIPGIRDMYCGFRAIKTDYLKKMEINASGFELEPEMLLEAVKQGMNIGFVDVQTEPLEKTHLKFEDYLKTNDLFDRWVLKNRDMIKCNIFKKYFLIISAHAGLMFSKALKKFKNKEKL